MYIEREVNGKIIYGWGETIAYLEAPYPIPVTNWAIGPFVKNTDKLYYGCFDK